MQFADPTFIVLCLSALTALTLLGFVLRNPGLRTGFRQQSDRAQAGRGFQVNAAHLLLVYALVTLGWVVLQGIARLQTLKLIYGFDLYILARCGMYFLLLLAVLLFQLTRLFQRKSGAVGGWWAVFAGLLVVTALLYENPLRLPDTLMPFGPFFILRWLLAFAVVVTGWGLFMGGSILLTFRNYRETVSPLHRNRIQYWSLAVMLAITGQGLLMANLTLMGNLLHSLAAVTMAYALLTFNLPDLRTAARRFSSYLIMLLITVAVYAGGFYGIQALSRTNPGYNPLLVGTILALVLALLFNPLLSAVQRLVTRLITGTRYDPRQTLSEYSMSISNILDLDVLATIVVGLISEAMEISHGGLVIVHYEPGEAFWEEGSGKYNLRSVSGLGQEMPEGQLSGKNPVVYYLRREHRPLTQYDIDLLPRFHVMEPDERTWLASLGMDVYVPIYAKESWIGLLVLGRKLSGDRYFDEDLALLQTLADQTAVALENARLYDDLKLRNAENERLNVQLKDANAELARLDQAKSDFINIASHELRTPLTQVIGYNDILGEMIRSNDLQQAVGVQMVDSVRKAARRLEEIVETMFDVSKLDTKTLDLMRAPISLNSIVTVAIDTWRKGLDERKQTISVRGISGLPTIVADGKRLTQVFSHLVQNAIKSTPDGGQIRITGRVVVMEETAPEYLPTNNQPAAAAAANLPATNGSANGSPAVSAGNLASAGSLPSNGSLASATSMIRKITSAKNGAEKTAPAEEMAPAIAVSGSEPPGEPIQKPAGERFVEIIVADTGIGISSDDLERIFEKFYRVGNVLLHSSGDTKFKGAGPGLGLTIARGIVEAHGGRIWAESPGHDEESCPGARFHVLLPIKVITADNPKIPK